MSQHDMTVDNGPGLTVRNDINSALQALASLSSGASAPNPSFPCQLWADTGTGRFKRRNAANSAWLDEGPLDAALRDAASQGGYVADTGVANAYVCNFVPALTARTESTPLRFKVVNGNSGASTINDGVGTVAIVGATHAALQGGEIVANGIAFIQWNASVGGSGAYVLLFCTGAAGPIVNQVQTAFTAGGSSPSLTLTPAPALAGYAPNQRFRVKFNASSTGADTLNISSLGAKSLKQYGPSGSKVAAIFASGQLSDVEYDGTDLVVLSPLATSVMDRAFNEAPVVTLASSATVNIGAALANTITITGTATISAFDSIASGAVRRLVFSGALTLTHNGSSLILSGGANILTTPGDSAEFVSLGSGAWRCISYTRSMPPPVLKQTCTSWVLFIGTGTPAIRDSFNVLSITRVGTGNYTVNFAQPMANTAYSVSAAFDSDADAVNAFSAPGSTRSLYIQESIKSTGAFRVLTGANGTTSVALDFRGINLHVFGGN